MNGIGLTPIQVVGWNRNGERPWLPQPQAPALGASLSVNDSVGRQNVAKLTMAVAMAGGGIYAMMNVPGAKRVQQVALGMLGGGLIVGAMVNLYDVVA